MLCVSEETGTVKRYLVDITSGAIVALTLPVIVNNLDYKITIPYPYIGMVSTSLDSDYLSNEGDFWLRGVYRLSEKEEEVFIKSLLESVKIVG